MRQVKDDSSKLAPFFRNAPCEICAFDTRTLKFTAASKMLLAKVDASLAKFLERTPLDLLEGFDDSSFRDLIAGLVEDGESVCSLKMRYLRKDGSTFRGSVSLVYEPCEPSQIIAWIHAETKESPAHDAALNTEQMLLAAIGVLPDGFVLYDRNDRLVVCNEQYRRFYPKSAPAMVEGVTFREILEFGLAREEYADAKGRENAWLEERLRAHKRASTVVEQKLSDGRWLRILERQTPDGGRVGLRIDITDQIESRERAEKAEQRLSDAIDALPAAFWLFDAEDRLVMLNAKYKQMFSTSAEQLELGMTHEQILRASLELGQYPSAAGREEAFLKKVSSQRDKKSYEMEYQLDDGTWIHSLNEATSEGGSVGFRLDITELKNRQFELEKAAQTDFLTKLANRRGVGSYVSSLGDVLSANERVCFLDIDLDKFKTINDVIGHDAGDFVLSHVAGILQSQVSSRDLVARIGGDEFLVCLITTQTDDEVLSFASDLRHLISAPLLFKGRRCHFGASIGISLWQQSNSISIDDAVHNADIALNDSKKMGRNRCILFQESMRDQTLHTAQLAQEIVAGLENDEFKPFFQPQLDITGSEACGFESLARWHHPVRGLLPASSFLFAAEDAGLVDAIDRVVLKEALQFIEKLSLQGFEHLGVSVNVSSAQLSDPNIVQQYLWNLDAHNVSPRQLRIEILESTLLDERSAHVVQNIRDFAKAGFSIELDDFGTGHTAIASLQKFPVQRIKIDRSLIAGVDQKPDLRVITDAVVGLGRKLDLEVLAEGVETEAERQIMQEAGCTCAQGYLFAHPMPEADIFDWLLRRESDQVTQSA